MDTVRQCLPRASSSVELLAAAAAGLAAGLSLGGSWSPLHWLLAVLCQY